jgi:hypothetical protein
MVHYRALFADLLDSSDHTTDPADTPDMPDGRDASVPERSHR